jgi:cathepsin D
MCPLPSFNTDTIQAYWQTKFDGIKVNESDIPVSNKQVIIDTGTSLVLGDPDSISNFYKSIPNSEPVNGPNGLWSCTFVTELTVGIAG